ncbi:MAG: molybdopterin-binding protein [Pyrinomonas sp.]|uniref:molybdopterin-dependent oxidoreductase n=1 Tax=Pyrinomonas sp. TaxID=2080306 RepID=UPI0033228846
MLSAARVFGLILFALPALSAYGQTNEKLLAARFAGPCCQERLAAYGRTDEKLLVIAGEGVRATELSAADLAKLPHRTVRAKDHDGEEATFEGIELYDLLKSVGVPFGTRLRGDKLSLFLLVEAADGYKVVFALPEIDKAFTDRVILLADRRNGKHLSAAEGNLRLVVPDEKRHARWVRQVVRLSIRRSPS